MALVINSLGVLLGKQAAAKAGQSYSFQPEIA